MLLFYSEQPNFSLPFLHSCPPPKKLSSSACSCSVSKYTSLFPHFVIPPSSITHSSTNSCWARQTHRAINNCSLKLAPHLLNLSLHPKLFIIIYRESHNSLTQQFLVSRPTFCIINHQLTISLRSTTI